MDDVIVGDFVRDKDWIMVMLFYYNVDKIGVLILLVYVSDD